jgi:hypothetical protein
MVTTFRQLETTVTNETHINNKVTKQLKFEKYILL